MSKQNNKPYRVLCMDGGGVRGYYSASVLENLSKLFDYKEKDIGKKFDLICGTSTGAILACALASGISIRKINKLYRNNAECIFPSPVPKNMFKLGVWTLKHWIKPSSNRIILEKHLTKIFSETTLGELYQNRKIALCIPVVNLDNKVAEIFKTPHHPNLNRDDFLSIKDACLASSAAPIYFPVTQFKKKKKEMHYVDGGLWANNPVLVGLIEALWLSEKNQNIEIYSISTLTLNSANPKQTKKLSKGIYNWKMGLDILDITMQAQSDGHNDMAMLLAGRLQDLGKNVSIFRFPETVKSSAQIDSLGLDSVDSLSFQAMDSLALRDAESIKSKANSNSPDPVCLAIKDLFI